MFDNSRYCEHCAFCTFENCGFKKKIKELQSNDTEYLLEHFRKSSVFKCFECIYCKREETHLGNQYKCVHDGVAVHCGMKDEIDIMLGCACFWFEPRGTAGEAVARRKAKILDLVRKLDDFANRQIQHTATGESSAEKQLAYIRRELFNLGVRL